jgi:23S rRNA pseudouridine1911/1915/1917 synthase
MQEELFEPSELYEHHRIMVDRGQALLRIDKYLDNRLENVSRNKIQQASRAGNILVNGTPVKSNYKVKPADVISVVLPYPHHEFELIPEDIPLNILYEDESVVVVNKEAGMVVHPGHGNYTGTLVNALAWHLKDLPLFKTGEVRPGLVHRIDKDTSGILVIAKTELALNKLARQFFNRTTHRTYNALVWGHFDKDSGTIEGNIGRNIRDRLKMQVFKEDDQGKPAVTHYHVLENLGYVSLLECKLETGRTHQIRVHMEYAGHPVFNDERYGGNKILRGTTFAKYRQFVQNCFTIMPRHALHAKSLGFVHPETNKEMFFDSELPPDFQQVLEKWRNYTGERN